MALDADTLLDRMQLKQQLMRWRSLSIVFLVAFVVLLINREAHLSNISPSYIARIDIDGIITHDADRERLLEELREDDSVKAVIATFNTPGGTAVGGEELYLGLKRIAEHKPVVSLMQEMCASAGYMAAIAGDHILAREGTITGSVGVIMQSFGFTELAESIGVEAITVKSGPNKAAPNPLEKITPSQRKMVENVVDDFYAFFLRLVTSERELTEGDMVKISDGRIFTGNQAVAAKLVDGIGGEHEALKWLEETHNIASDTRVKTVKPTRKSDDLWSRFNQLADQALTTAEKLPTTLDGLAAIWQPALAD